MAQIEPKDNGGKKKKGAQKKMHIHVDFTPMVDMNMLLISFFMLCTTLIKSQTLNISLPTNEKVDKTEQNKAKKSEAVTLILASDYDDKGNVTDNTIYYYTGKPFIEDADKDGFIDLPNDGTSDGVLKVEKFKGNDGNMVQGIRKILHDRNEEVLKQIDELKKKWRNPANRMSDAEFEAEAKKIRNDSTISRPVVIIKATPEASWESVISALDEMQINQISRYQIDNINGVDSVMILDYLAKQRR